MIDTLGDILRNNAYKFPDELAWVLGDDRITFREHHDRAQKLASAIFVLGVRRQDRISILSQNTREFMEIYSACELAGFIATTVKHL